MLAAIKTMLVNPRVAASLVLACCILPGVRSLADGPRSMAPGMLESLVNNATYPVAVNERPDVFPVSVFGIPIDGKATFSAATDKLGATIIQRIDEGGANTRYICYRSSRGKPAVVAIFTSHSPVAEDLIDGFAFGLQSGVPDATKVCRQVPWLKASDLHFDKIWLDMPPGKLPGALLKISTGVHDGTLSIEWRGPDKATASGTGDPAFTAFNLVGVSAAFINNNLVFFHVKDATAYR